MKPATAKQAAEPSKPAEMTWPDYLVMLLHIAAEIEHGLMIEYLYAAYSLGGEQVPKDQRPMVERWRASILAIAKEEMGHLLSVQNVLTLLGAPLNLYRRDYPWDSPYYPFPFRLEPLTLQSLSCYVYAEMPPDDQFVLPPGRRLRRQYREFEQKDRKRIVNAVRKRLAGQTAHEVGAVYAMIIDILKDPARIPDSMFHDHTISVQASWDDWGRGYKPPPKALDAEGSLADLAEQPRASDREARTIIVQMATRTEAVAALRDISAQGEAPHLATGQTGEPSHFERFLEIYQELEHIRWKPAPNVPVNPTTSEDSDEGTVIKAEPTRTWANLFNLRYRMLLSYLSHTFRLARITRGDEPTVRAATMHRVFCEMYNLKTIAGMLVRLPIRPQRMNGKQKGKRPRFAGPPFEMPYTLTLPPAELDCWRLHQSLLTSSDQLCDSLLRMQVHDDGKRYLEVLRDIDRQSFDWIDKIITGLQPNERHDQ